MVVIFYNIFTDIIAFLFTKAAQDLAWRIVVLLGTEPSVPQADNPHVSRIVSLIMIKFSVNLFYL